jgi:hypothetical protein
MLVKWGELLCHVRRKENDATSCLSTIMSTNSTSMEKLFNFSNVENNFSGKFQNCRFIFC